MDKKIIKKETWNRKEHMQIKRKLYKTTVRP